MQSCKALCLLARAGALAGPGAAVAQESCKSRGELDQIYCDENRDLVAEDSGTPFNRSGFDKERAQEEAARKNSNRAATTIRETS